MTNITNIQTLATVTAQEIARCEKVTDCNTGLAFYIVQSENYAENYQEYRVEAIVKNGRHHIVCNCDAGKKGVPCKHRRWAMAAAKLEKANQEPRKYVTNVDDETIARIEKANATAKVDRRAKAPTYKPFSLLR